MPAQQTRSAPDGETPKVVFDRAHLSHYTMQSVDLEREIINLFLQQLPSTVEMIASAGTEDDWKLYTHTLKGSAAAVGAWKLQEIAIELESLGNAGDAMVRDLRLKSLQAAVVEFREMVRQIYL